MSSAIMPMPPFVWQQDLWSGFCERLAAKKLPHAFLLTAQAGVGANALGLAMGQYLLCLSPLDNIACGQCKGCHLLNAESHPDLMRVSLEEKATQIKVDQIREISAFVSKTPQQGGYKVVLLTPAESMNVNAANALLKNLEEPAGKTVFILVSEEPSRILPTIRSRCAKISLPIPQQQQALEWLNSSGVDNAQSLLEEAHGAPLLAKEWFDSGMLEQRHALVSAMADIANHQLEPMLFAKQWGSQEPLWLVKVMMSAIDTVLMRTYADKPVASHFQALNEAMSRCQPLHLFRLRDRLCEKREQAQGSSNLNAALFVEELALDWYAVCNARR